MECRVVRDAWRVFSCLRKEEKCLYQREWRCWFLLRWWKRWRRCVRWVRVVRVLWVKRDVGGVDMVGLRVYGLLV